MSNNKIKLGIVGVGKIVRDQHIPSIESNGGYDLTATASRNASLQDVKAYKTIEEMLASDTELDAVSLCMPPQYRYAAAKLALENGLHVLLEKPPGATVSEVHHLETIAKQNNVSLYATWHSRHGAAVEQAKTLLANSQIESVNVNWKENVKKWHPGQEWIWQAGGLGVFDPGINGLSIMTHILPEAVFVQSASLLFPSNKAAPIAADMTFCTASGAAIELDFDWRVTGDELWAIDVTSSNDQVTVSDGGGSLQVNGEIQAIEEVSPYGEYQAIYARFAEIIRKGDSDVDLSPLTLVADAFLLAERETTEAFHE